MFCPGYYLKANKTQQKMPREENEREDKNKTLSWLDAFLVSSLAHATHEILQLFPQNERELRFLFWLQFWQGNAQK